MAAVKDKGNFAQGSVSSNILRLAGPMVIAQMINVLYNLVDRMYIGRLAETGRLALTGIGICAPVLTIIMAFANLCGVGGSPLFSMARGKGDDKQARHIIGNAFFMMISLGVILTIIAFAIKKPLLYWLGADEETYVYANQYLSVYLIGSIAVMISLGMNPFINAQGAGRTGMLTVAIGAVINIILDPIFIFALDMGVSGAALATIISQAASAVWVLAFLCGKRAAVKFSLADMRPKAETIKRITLLGTSGFCLSFTTSLVQMLCNTNLRDLGGTLYVSIMTVINSIRDIFFAGVNGLTNGTTPVISYNYGAGKYSRVREAIRFCTGASLLYCIVAWAVIMIFPGFFIRIFNSDPELLEIGVRSFHIYFAAFAFMAFQLTGQVVSLALGKAKTAIFFSLLRKVIVMAPLIIILPKLFGLGVNGVFLAEPISNVIGGLACWITMMLTVYRPLKNKADEPDILPE
ncbi:MAG: MATE family efflux transporter [Oscillospiraceae bacterium]|nr:MATE family efflux transporter [Oscillospiraceae bacterium]